jgi:hypothetical protein
MALPRAKDARRPLLPGPSRDVIAPCGRTVARGANVTFDGVWGDVVFLAITTAFFAVAWALVRVCERITQGDEVTR